MKKEYFIVSKQAKDGKGAPEVFVVEMAELSHFLHENLKEGSEDVLVFDNFPASRLYTIENHED